jgi:hypothetical protein
VSSYIGIFYHLYLFIILILSSHLSDQPSRQMNASKDDYKGVGADMVKIKKEPAVTKSYDTGSSKKNPITLNDSASESSDDNNYKDGGDEDDEESNSDDKVNRNNNGMRYEDSNNHKYEHNEDESDGIESYNTNEGPPGVNRQTATDFDEDIAHGKFLAQSFDSVFYEGEEFNDGGSLGSGSNNDDGINNHGGSNDDVRGCIETNDKERKKRGMKDKRNSGKGDPSGSSDTKGRDRGATRGEFICRNGIDNSIP